NMKKILFAFAFTAVLSTLTVSAQSAVKVDIDLINVKDDKVMVTVNAPKITTDQVAYHIPKNIPGAYSADECGKFVENLTAYDSKGKTLTVSKTDDNSWTISNAKSLSKVTYWVNDTYDVEQTHDIFSPAGTNISEGNNFMLNMHGFVGYFTDKKALPYQVTVSHPATLWGATAMVDSDASDTKDVFNVSRYAELVDNHVMYSKPDYSTFKVDGMEILISVYSANGTVDAKGITQDMEKMMRAQKKFLGPINATKKYAILLYLSDMQSGKDAQGFGAHEHNTSTTVVCAEMIPRDQLIHSMIDVVSH